MTALSATTPCVPQFIFPLYPLLILSVQLHTNFSMADAPQVADTVADAAEVAHAEPCPEAVQSHPRSALPYGAKWVNDPRDSPYVAASSTPPKTVLGLRRRNLCIICMIAVLLVGAIIGGSVGGIAVVKKNNVGYASTPRARTD